MQSYKKTKRGRKRWGTNNRSAPDVLSWKQMHCYHLVSNVSGPDWSLICHSHRKKSKSLSNCSFFFFPHFLPLYFLHSLSFIIHYKCVTGYRRLVRGEQCVVTLGTALQLSAWLQLPLSAGRGGPGRHPSAHLPLRPSTTSRINRRATPYKRSAEVHASQYSAPPTMTSRAVHDWEWGSAAKMESCYGQIQHWSGRGEWSRATQKINKNRNLNGLFSTLIAVSNHSVLSKLDTALYFIVLRWFYCAVCLFSLRTNQHCLHCTFGKSNLLILLLYVQVTKVLRVWWKVCYAYPKS